MEAALRHDRAAWRALVARGWKSAAYTVPLLIAADAVACTCEWPDPQTLYRQSDIVVLARVERLRPDVHQGSGSGTRSTLCHASLQPIEAFKGVAGEPMEVTYDASSPMFCGRAEDTVDVREVVVKSCAHDMAIGETYLVFRSGEQPMHLESTCDPRVQFGEHFRREFLKQLGDGG